MLGKRTDTMEVPRSRRLIGRSVWNSKWKLVIPGYTLLNDPEEGLDRFIQTVEDIKGSFQYLLLFRKLIAQKRI